MILRCYICNSDIQDPTIDPRDGRWRPCYVCEAAIDEYVGNDYDDDDDDPYEYYEDEDGDLL